MDLNVLDSMRTMYLLKTSFEVNWMERRCNMLVILCNGMPGQSNAETSLLNGYKLQQH